MKFTSAQLIRIQAVWPGSISPVPSPMVYVRVRGKWGGVGVNFGSVLLRAARATGAENRRLR